ncbi:MAG: glycosyl hydrolase family 18 protein [Bryobacteraceae bacterium]
MRTSRVNVILILMLGASALWIVRSWAGYGPDLDKKAASFKVVGYLAGQNFRRIDELELNRLTYLNLAFANPDKSGELVFDGGFDIAPVVSKGHAAGLKVFVSLAGGGQPDTSVWKSVLLPENRSSFIRHIVDYVEKNSFDGVDVDIEGNLLPTIRESYNPFVVQLKQALHAKGKGITAALGAVHVHESITQEAIDSYDFINVMVYDKTGIWRPEDIGPHSPYSYAEEAIVFWTGKWKVSPERIVLGVPFYGFDFTPPARYIDFSEIVAGNPALAYQDSVAKRYYNGIPTIVQKTELAKHKLGGVMIWEIASDTSGDLSLLRALDQTIKAGNCPVKTFFKDEDGDGFGQLAKPFEACAAPAGYVVDNRDPNDADAKVHP